MGGRARQACVALAHAVTALRTSWRIMRTPTAGGRPPSPSRDPDWAAPRLGRRRVTTEHNQQSPGAGAPPQQPDSPAPLASPQEDPASVLAAAAVLAPAERLVAFVERHRERLEASPRPSSAWNEWRASRSFCAAGGRRSTRRYSCGPGVRVGAADSPQPVAAENEQRDRTE